MGTSGDRGAQARANAQEPAATGGRDDVARRPEAAPATPTGAGGWFAALKRAVADYRADNAGDLAAALTYYGVLSIFPALIALLSILGLVGRGTTKPLVDSVTKIVPGEAQKIFTNSINGLQNNHSSAGIIFFVGILAALWSASGYVSAFMRTSNAIYDVEETRPFLKLSVRRLVLTIALVAMLVISSLAVVTTGSVARSVGDAIGVGNSAVQAWDIAKWPVLLVIVAFMITLLYWASPNLKHPSLASVAPGALFAVVVWLLASLLFALYVAGFSSYDKTYGSIAGVVVFLVWLWITNIALLVGAEFNSELVRVRRRATAPTAPPKE
jgi:membrane protein